MMIAVLIALLLILRHVVKNATPSKNTDEQRRGNW